MGCRERGVVKFSLNSERVLSKEDMLSMMGMLLVLQMDRQHSSGHKQTE
jgi:hypothetical protein